MIPWPEPDRWRAPVGDFPPLWASAWGDDRFGLWADLTVRGVTQRMRWIEPSGEAGFLMGSPQAERDAIRDKDVRKWANDCEHEPRLVVVAPGFWLADTPCTQAFWQVLMGENPSHFQDVPDAPQCPVEQVSFDDVERFLAVLEALPEARLQGRVALPTEVQWEYAARAGSTTAYWWGDEADGQRANWGHQCSTTTPVRRHAANPWGLFDVYGNVLEWCADPWLQRLDRLDAEPDSSARAVRGGSWVGHPGYARSAHRDWWYRDYLLHFQGFRVLLRSSSPAPEGPTAR